MRTTTIHNWTKYLPSLSKPTSQALIFLCCLSIATETPGQETQNPLPIEQPIEQIRDCALYITMASQGLTSLERSYALSALKDCPSTEKIRTTLETAIEDDDAYCRRKAFFSLQNHLTAASLPLLIRNLRQPTLYPEERRQIFSYLEQLATVGLAEDLYRDLREIFVEGLSAGSEAIRRDSLLGLGKLKAFSEWERILKFLQQPNNRLREAALQGILYMQVPDALQVGIGQLRHQDPLVQAAAIRLLASLTGPQATEELIRLDFEGGVPAVNAVLLSGKIRQKIQKEDPEQPFGLTRQISRLYVAPNDRAEISAILERATVLYIEEKTRVDYDLAPARELGPSGTWYRIRTRTGAAGWLHESVVVRPLLLRTLSGNL